MSMLFAWIPRDADAEVAGVVSTMSAALAVHDAQQRVLTCLPGVGVGVLEPPPIGTDADDFSPVSSEDGRYTLWMAGEVFGGDDNGRTPAFRRRLLSEWLSRGADAVRDLDGEYHIAVWDRTSRALTVLNDRFGGLPLYVAESRHGVAIAGGVRGALIAPGVDATPNAEALREAMTFGGYRLGSRTNVRGVRMLPGGIAATITGADCRVQRYWSWRDIKPVVVRDVNEAVAQTASLWRAAMARRMRGSGRFGQTLSGGLDSRAILAEAPAQHWTAITYGVPGCDDARHAKRAATAAGARWLFYEMYSGANPDWLDRRNGFIQQTDGLMQLGDLAHVEALDLQRASFDVHLSGYVGDAVSGPTFGAITTAEAALLSCPYYETEISLGWTEALARITAAVAGLDGAPARFVHFEHKLPQSTNRWPTSWRPWLRVRKPFLDYAFFDFCQGLPASVRVDGMLHERWLLSAYPQLFARIPNHKTGVPVLSPAWRVLMARAGRGARRALRRALPAPLKPAPLIRSYLDDERAWRQPQVIDRITGLVDRKDSVCSQILGDDAVHGLLSRWRETARAPTQVVGALYVFEMYHRDLAAALARAARVARAGSHPIPSQIKAQVTQ